MLSFVLFGHDTLSNKYQHFKLTSHILHQYILVNIHIWRLHQFVGRPDMFLQNWKEK